jgi:hypothetical protein
MDDRLERVIRGQLRKAGRQFEAAKRAYEEGRTDTTDANEAAERYDLPVDGTRSDGPSRSTRRGGRRVSRPPTPTVRGVPQTFGRGASRRGDQT